MKHKLDFRSDLCLFLGYSEQHKGYKCLSITSKTYISRNVVFDESLFPYLQHFAKTASSPSTTSPLSYSPTLIPQIPLVTSNVVHSSPTANAHKLVVTNAITNPTDVPLSTAVTTDSDRSRPSSSAVIPVSQSVAPSLHAAAPRSSALPLQSATTLILP